MSKYFYLGTASSGFWLDSTSGKTYKRKVSGTNYHPHCLSRLQGSSWYSPSFLLWPSPTCSYYSGSSRWLARWFDLSPHLWNLFLCSSQATVTILAFHNGQERCPTPYVAAGVPAHNHGQWLLYGNFPHLLTCYNKWCSASQGFEFYDPWQKHPYRRTRTSGNQGDEKEDYSYFQP